MKNIKNYFTRFEIGLWTMSILLIIFSFIIFGGKDYLTLIASIIGATFLILNAKGNPLGQFLTIVFSFIYGIISYRFAYYGEMITYLGMTMPMACFALISWLKNPYKDVKSQVKVNKISQKEIFLMFVLTIIVTTIFYYLLKFFNNANLLFSTLSIATSFIAAYLTFRRSSFFALAYACNDIVLIILWVLASIKDNVYVSVVICFIVFLVNDLYGFISWIKMERSQNIKNSRC